ncbi:hypothetical protein [Microcoleus sp. B9-D4]|uniref:hypothetical protein n=1 Tax=Microcoleus sp. B9-D4 TaxID=2818711 RepID=UPI002FD02E23
MNSNQLQDTENGLLAVFDFMGHQHESIGSGFKQADIPYEIKFHSFNPDNLWKEGAFRVYVAPVYVKIATELCLSMRYAPASYEFDNK